MKSVMCVLVVLLATAEAFGQCETLGVQGGCNSGAQRGNPGGGRQPAPPIVPPTTSPSPVIIPSPPLVSVPPVVPSVPQPTVQAKSCECDNDKLAAAIEAVAVSLNQIKAAISSDGDRLTALEKSAPAGPPQIDEAKLAQSVADKLGLNKPQPDPTKPTHYVLVADGSSYGELQNYVNAARAKFPRIVVVDSKEVPFPVIGGYPQLVSYDNSGKMLDVLKGITPVERELGRIAMK